MQQLIFLFFGILLLSCSPEAKEAMDESDTTAQDAQETPIPPSVAEMSLQEASEAMLRTLKQGGTVDEYVQKFAEVPLETLSQTINTDTKRKAFWINIYNAYIQKILTEEPKLYDDRKAFFEEDRVTMAGKKISFDRIEHGIIRSSTLKLSGGYVGELFPGDYEKALRTEKVDPRIHFAVNCGAIDCPPIHILSPGDLDEELDRMSRAYLQKWTTYDAKADTVATTSLISWFRGDFGGKDGGKEFLKKYGVLPMEAEDPKLKFKPYDWTLKTGVFGE